MKKRGTQKYSDEVREKIVNEYQTTDIGLRELEAKYGIKSGTIFYWVKRQREAEKNVPGTEKP